MPVFVGKKKRGWPKGDTWLKSAFEKVVDKISSVEEFVMLDGISSNFQCAVGTKRKLVYGMYDEVDAVHVVEMG